MGIQALVVLSGGQDSTTCAFWAREQGYEVHAITFDYGQKHRVELDAARRIARMVGAVTHEVVELGAGILKGTSPLVNSGERLEQYASHHVLPGGIEKTFVPMRNQLFLTIAANRAYCLGSNILVTGVCEEDYGGYPDCRLDFIKAVEVAGSLGTFNGEGGAPYGLHIATPLMHLTKAESVRLAWRLPGCYEALAYTHTAYDGLYPPKGHDHASLLRAKGFEEACIPDPLVLRAWNERLMDLPTTVNYSPELIDEAIVKARL